ncbi:hypothetical protein, partial [Amycolatopsis japonica]|uniref:hypothetical protein n=1 Tax=Amycolatopsis japonica TaxID=208439 RepID=UPI0033F40CE7
MPTLKVGKGAFTDYAIAICGSVTPLVPGVTATGREGLLPLAEPSEGGLHVFAEYVKVPFTASSAMKGAFTDYAIATCGSATPPVPAVAATAREGLLSSAEPSEGGLHVFAEYVKVPFTASSAMKGAFTDY